MINASNEFEEKLKDGANIVNYADATLSDGTVLNLGPGDFMIGGCTVTDKTTDGKFGIGFTIGKTLTLKIANHDERFSSYDFYYSTIYLYVAMQLDDGTVEKIRKGKYYTTTPETPGDVIDLTAVDGMYLLDRDYSDVPTVYPATLQAILSDICLYCGIPIGFKQFDRYNYVIQERPENTVTCRQMVSYVCQMAGYNARIDNDGYMQLVWYDTERLKSVYNGGDFYNYPHDTVLDGGNFTDYSTATVISGGNFSDADPTHIFRIKSLSVSTDNVVITGVKVKVDEEEYLSGEEGYIIEISNNPLVEGNEQETADYLGERMIGAFFRPFSADVLQNPLYEPFDVCKVSDRKGNVYYSIINSVSYTVGGYTQIACEAEDPVRNGSSYVSEAAEAVVQARKNTEKQLSAYDLTVQNMNQLAANAMGFYTTYEDQADGSRITYLHDKPTLAGSTIIYKQTIDGFFLSRDGGKSYTAGFDSNGNAVVNILSAIGILFDWAKGGTLTLGGNGNGNGILKILNSSGTQIGYIDNTGVHFPYGEFSGSLNAATGTFSGTVSAGKVTGSEIEGSTITTVEDSDSAAEAGKMVLKGGKLSFYYDGTYFGAMSPDFDSIIDESTGEANAEYYLLIDCNISARQVYEFSDERKKDIMPWNAAYVDFLMGLSPICFTWKEGNDRRIHTGFGAQSVKKILQESGIEKSALVSGNDSTAYSISYSEMHAIEVAAIQENRKMISNLENRIQELEDLIKGGGD